MKLVIQIPCYNEEHTLPIALQALPKEIPGIDTIEVLIINDGSTDATVDVARAHGVDHVVSFSTNKGLARGFIAGLRASLIAGADIIVNTDADNQYCADDIPAIIRPILEGKAEIVVGARPIQQIQHFSPMKKLLQRIGSWVVRMASDTAVEDAPSGFRAISREAAMRLNVFNDYTYTLETLIQAGQQRMTIASVPVRTNGDLRPSRLVSSIRKYVTRSFTTIWRIFATYRPLRFFGTIGLVFLVLGTLLGVRFLIAYFGGHGQGMLQSLVLAAVLLLMGFQTCVLGVLADIINVNRRLLEDIQLDIRRQNLGNKNDRAISSLPSDYRR